MPELAPVTTTDCDIAVIGGGIAGMHAIKAAAKIKGLQVAAVFANPFIEFSMGAAEFLCDHKRHSDYICGRPESWQVKGVRYIFEPVTEIDPAAKTIKFASGNLTYRAVIVCTGSRMPLIMPQPGVSAAARVAEVKKVSDAIGAAQTVVFNGSGTIGVEMAGDCRAKHPNKRIVLLSRDGSVLAKSHPPEMQKRVLDVLTRVLKVEVVKGSAPRDWLEPRFEAGSIPISGNDDTSEIAFDFYMPTFAQGVRNEPLDGLDERGLIDVNECLQSKKHPTLFGTNTTNLELKGHPITSRVKAAATTAVRNAELVINGKPPTAHKDSEPPTPLPRPMNIKIGHGKGGYMIWDTEQYDPCMKLCVFCTPCKCGFPFWPPVCCWCCAPGCSHACGVCCGEAEGEGAAILMPCLLRAMMKDKGFKGAGLMPDEAPQVAPQAEAISRG